MKSFKLNAFEKFVIRYKKLFIALLFLAFFVWQITFSLIEEYVTVPAGTFIHSLLLSLLFLYIYFMPEFKNFRANKAYKNLDLGLVLDGACKLAEVSSPKDVVISSTIRNNKAAYLIEAGRFSEAESELKLFFHIFDTRKLRPLMLFTVHINFAILRIYNGDEKGYREQLKIIESYYDKIKKSKSKAEISIADRDFSNIKFFEQAHFGQYSDNFEQRVLFDRIKFFGSKDRPKIYPIDYFDIYSILFTYFARFENTEKAVYYANEIVKIGNDSLFEYRKAKEYLENADKCN